MFARIQPYLNVEKCKLSQKSIRFLGYIIDDKGVHPDPDKIKAIQQAPRPNNVGDTCHFLGMANQMTKFTPNLAEVTKPLRDLLSSKKKTMGLGSISRGGLYKGKAYFKF